MTVDRPEPTWEEPRGPHLPDWTARIPGSAWAFLAVAALVAWRAASDLLSSSIDEPATTLSVSLSIAGRVAAPLLGAALFVRHPDALREHRALALGCALLAASVLAGSFRGDVHGLLDGLAGDTESFGPSPWSTAYGAAVTLAAAGGLLALGRGLRAARTRASRLSERPLLVVALAVPVATAVIATSALLGTEGQEDMLGVFLVSNAAGLAVGIAWAVLAVEALAGAHAGEAPATGWRLAAVATWGMLAEGLWSLLAGLFYMAVPDAALAASGLLSVVSVAGSLMWLLLLAAFAAGLPAGRARAEGLEQ